MLLDFDDIQDVSNEEIQDNVKGKAKVCDEDLSKPFKEVLKCPFTRIIVEFSSPGHRMPANAKIYDGTSDPEDHQTLDGKARAWFEKLPPGSIENWGSLHEKFLNRFGMLKACDKDPTEISKIVRKASETLPHFKERCVSESNAIPNVPELMQISSFMSSHKCPELAKRFSNNIPKIVDEMLKRVDDYLRSEEAFRSTELPRGSSNEWTHQYSGCNEMTEANGQREKEDTEGKCDKTCSKAKKLISTEEEDHNDDEGWMTIPIICSPFHMRPHRKKPLESRLVETQTTVSGFSGEQVKPLGKIELDVCFGGSGRCRRAIMKFTVIPAPSPYNIILGHPGLKQLRAGKKQAVESSENVRTQDNIIPKEQVVTKEVAKWLKARIVRPVKYPTWISNQVLVKKADGSWRMCIDFKNINSACPKDYYPLPKIDSKIEAVMGFPLKCFLDAYKGYHQVQMADKDEEKTAFYTDQGTYFYTKMPFGLKNAGATYQRLVDEAFQSQIGKNVEVYVDDMVVKSRTEREMLADISETFDNLRRINMKLNPKKYSFGVIEGKFLGYMVTSEGIRANPAKTKDIAEMQSPKTWGEMQSLAGKLAALNHFLSRSAEKSLPFFETLKDINKENKHDYRWTERIIKHFLKSSEEVHLVKTYRPGLNNPSAKRNPICIPSGIKRSSERSTASGKARKVTPCALYQSVKQVLNKADTSGSMHLKARLVVAKAIRQGYYWPTMHRNVREEIHKCDSCQIHSPIPKLPKTFRTSIMAPWPFFQWGMDVLGPLLEAPRKINTAVAHPQANGLVERANRSLMKGIKTRLGRERKGWVEELPNVLWAHRTSLKTNNGETPYSLTFGSEAVILAEIGMPMHRTMMIKEGNGNEEEMGLNLDLLTERREAVVIREAWYKMKMKQYYNKRVCPMSFKVSEHVYQKNEASRVENLGKLGPKWEGPYLVVEAYQNGSYKLRTMDDQEVPRVWHAINLRR
ncbi:reverse transcriptase domain-containing protein [Tanacetum coccineum]|uniref:Reverse transcriptase domain-containing protein n=1 Tax=Tanacetum coccineum TaxID=301880 RepID=A0ABQ5EZJ1_9ASTR